MSLLQGRTALAYARTWHNIDASEAVLGRLASRIASILIGKHKPIYSPATDCGDYVVVSNCSKLEFTGDKLRQKVYYRHTTKPGVGFKQITMERMIAKKSYGEVLRKAVSGMLPKNRLRDKRLERLKTYDWHADYKYRRNFLKLH